MPLAELATLAGQAGGQLNNFRQNLHGRLWNEFDYRRNKKEGDRQYNRQYQDNIAFWRMQNEYNSPQAQMERYKQAGLNPNLVYGAGNPGNAGAPSPPQPQFVQAPDLQMQAAPTPRISEMYDLEMKRAQIDNLKVQNDVYQQDAILRRAQARATMTDAERKIFDLELARELRSYSIDAARENVRGMKVRTDIAIDENIRRAALTSRSLEESAERLLTYPHTRAEIKARIRKLLIDGDIAKEDLTMKKSGLNPSDPMYARILAQIMQRLIDEGLPELPKFEFPKFELPKIKPYDGNQRSFYPKF